VAPGAGLGAIIFKTFLQGQIMFKLGDIVEFKTLEKNTIQGKVIQTPTETLDRSWLIESCAGGLYAIKHYISIRPISSTKTYTYDIKVRKSKKDTPQPWCLAPVGRNHEDVMISEMYPTKQIAKTMAEKLANGRVIFEGGEK
jgi:hypothetical protein